MVHMVTLTIISCTGRTVDLHGIDDHLITNIPIINYGDVTKTHYGELIIIMHQYAYTGKGKMIHLSVKFEWYKNYVNNKSIKVASRLQRISTNDYYVYPLNIRDGLLCISMHPYSEHEWET
jgi:hypothetical protein